MVDMKLCRPSFFPVLPSLGFVLLSIERKSIRCVLWCLYVGYRSEAFLGKILKEFSGDQVVTWGLFGIGFMIFLPLTPDFLHW